MEIQKARDTLNAFPALDNTTQQIKLFRQAQLEPIIFTQQLQRDLQLHYQSLKQVGPFLFKIHQEAHNP